MGVWRVCGGRVVVCDVGYHGMCHVPKWVCRYVAGDGETWSLKIGCMGGMITFGGVGVVGVSPVDDRVGWWNVGRFRRGVGPVDVVFW